MLEIDPKTPGGQERLKDLRRHALGEEAVYHAAADPRIRNVIPARVTLRAMAAPTRCRHERAVDPAYRSVSRSSMRRFFA